MYGAEDTRYNPRYSPFWVEYGHLTTPNMFGGRARTEYKFSEYMGEVCRKWESLCINKETDKIEDYELTILGMDIDKIKEKLNNG